MINGGVLMVNDCLLMINDKSWFCLSYLFGDLWHMKIHGKSSNRRLELIMEHADLARKIMNTLRFMEIHWIGEENSD